MNKPDNILPTISVIVPIYNAEKTLNRCLDSLINQTFHDYELILVNDGSTDASLDICHQYASLYPFISIIDQKNGGVSAARNAGMIMAKGPFITFTDADDEVTPLYLSTFINLIDHNDLCIQSIMQIDPNGHLQTTTLTKQTCTTQNEMAEVIIEAYYQDIPISACNSLFRHDILERHHLRFDENIHVCEDADFVLRYLPHCQSVLVTSQANYKYYSPSHHKTYKEPNALRTSLKLIADTQELTDDKTLQKALRGLYLDWCIEELLHYTPNEEAHTLAAQFGRLCQPYLSESKRPSFRHRLFKRVCISNNPPSILSTAKAVMALYHFLQFLMLRNRKPSSKA